MNYSALTILFFICAGVGVSEAQQCQNLASGVSCAEKAKIVKLHNNLRNLLVQGAVPGQPKGKNFAKISWDNAIGRKAQDIANTCKYGHVDVQDPRWYVGQNIYWAGSTARTTNADWNAAINSSWFGEYENFVYPDQSNGGETGHYTQVVWAKTQKIGCGFKAYVNDPNAQFKYEKFYVCNYGPGGNIVGEAPYEEA